jgi:hypothetical protein
MELSTPEVVVEYVEQLEGERLIDLHALQLAMVGGGIGEVFFG